MKEKICLYGFNNLTKTLSFNIYDICYAKTEREKEDYIKYIDEQYNSERLTKILCDVTEMIGAHVLNISKQDYEPQGASVNVLITEEALPVALIDPSCNKGELSYLELRDSVVGHLDKSHLTVHTYPESNIFHTKMMLKDIVLNNYLFNSDPYELSPNDRREIRDRISKEMIEIYGGVNIY